MDNGEAQHAGHDDGQTYAAIKDEIDAVARHAEQRLADEVKDGTAHRRTNDCEMEQRMEDARKPVAGGARGRAFDELTHAAQIGERIGEHSQCGGHERGDARGLCELCVDWQCGWAFHEPLIDAKKPERRKATRLDAALFY